MTARALSSAFNGTVRARRRRSPCARATWAAPAIRSSSYDDLLDVTLIDAADEPTADATEIRRAATECLRRVELNRKLRLLGVRISTLTSASAQALKPRLPVQADLPFASDE